jgi:hypothetical protein
MKITLHPSIVITISALLATVLATPASASMPRPGKITCEEFVALDDAVKPKVVYWEEGFDKKGKPEDAEVDIDETDKLIPSIITECQRSPRLPFSKTMKTVKENMAKIKASAPKAK